MTLTPVIGFELSTTGKLPSLRGNGARGLEVNVTLKDKRILVVGASSGIGRAVAVQSAEAGARVVLAARRLDRLQETVRAAGPHTHALACDVRDAANCEAVVGGAVRLLGGLDLLVYATAIDPLVRLIEADASLWQAVLSTNVIGASLVCRAAIPHLRAARGRAVFISASSVGRPLPGMGPYETSKAALDELVRAWHGEHPEVGFSNVAVGQTLGTEVWTSWDPELMMELTALWADRGYSFDNGPGAMSVEDAAAAVIAAMAARADLRYVVALPPAGSTMPGPEGVG